MAKRMNFYIKSEEVREFIRKQGNQSHYIESLVIKDMENKGDTLTKDEIIELIKKYSSRKEEEDIKYEDLEVKNTLNELFDL